MKSTLEQTYALQREHAERLMKEELPDMIEMLCSFSDLDCIIDVKLEDGWQRYELVEPSEDEAPTVRRIG